MLNRVLLIFCISLQFCSYGQNQKFDCGLVCRLEPANKRFYEGESQYNFEMVVSNPSKRFIEVGMAPLVTQIDSIVYNNGKNINLIKKIDHYKEIERYAFFKDGQRKFLPNQEERNTIVLNANDMDIFASLSDYLPKGINPIEERYDRVLKAGKYKLWFHSQYWPEKDTVFSMHEFTIYPAKDSMLAQLREYSYALALMRGKDDVKFIASDSLPTLWRFTKQRPNSNYVLDALQHLLVTPPAVYHPSRCIWNFRNDTTKMFNLLEFLPQIRESGVFIYNILYHIDDFHAKGLVANQSDYIDSYLKRLENFNPRISYNIILNLSSDKRLRGFRNYAQERVEHEEKQKIRN